MLVFLFFGQGDFQIDFCSRLLRTSNVLYHFNFFFLFFSLFQAALNSERHPRLYTAPAGVRVQRTRQGCGFGVQPDSHWSVGFRGIPGQRQVSFKLPRAPTARASGEWEAFNWSAIDLLERVVPFDVDLKRWREADALTVLCDLIAVVLLRPFCVTPFKFYKSRFIAHLGFYINVLSACP